MVISGRLADADDACAFQRSLDAVQGLMTSRDRLVDLPLAARAALPTVD